MIAELNGKPIEPSALSGLALYNYGHFTSLTADRGKVRGLGLHLDRLQRDCRAVHGCDLDRDEARRLIGRVAVQVDGASVLRVTVFDPALDLGHPGEDLRPQCLVTSRRAPTNAPGPIALSVAEYVRDWPEVKHVGLFATVALRRAAQLDGYDDVAFHDGQGRLSEGATWNLGFIDVDGTVILPDQPSLPGVTLQLLCEALDKHGIGWRERTIRVDDASAMTAGFVTNAAVGVRPVSVFNGSVLDAHHPLLADLRRQYSEITAEAI
ncbi:aminotransferase class IV [Glycomyces xiaoerkulensis]|uniref:aminotransferase class IV n=1 Tax=Glycomyces xiaoerkulensis TaxID=2038139 RepID=UPI0018E4424D|nr:aminotransferase class IV [Glycomyces xiaoerkulensis]